PAVAPSSRLRLACAPSPWQTHPGKRVPQSMPKEHRHVAPWQRLTIYRYTLPPPDAATEHLFEELPLSTYPSGTTMEPLAYEMAPGIHLGRAAPWTQTLVLFPRCAPSGMAGARTLGVS